METSGCEPADLCEAFSTVILHTAVRDVDADDYDNPMLCSEYVKDIYKYLRELEVDVCLNIVIISYVTFFPYNQFPVFSRLSRMSGPTICRDRR